MDLGVLLWCDRCFSSAVRIVVGKVNGRTRLISKCERCAHVWTYIERDR